MLALTCISARSAAIENTRRRRQAGRHRLSGVDAAADDDAVDRRGDDRVDPDSAAPGSPPPAPAPPAPGSIARVASARSTATFAASRSLWAMQLLRRPAPCARWYFCCASADLHLRVVEIGRGLRLVGARLLDLGLEQRRVEPGDHLALVHDRVEIGAEPRRRCPRPVCRPARSSPPAACRSRRRRRATAPRVTWAVVDLRRSLSRLA